MRGNTHRAFEERRGHLGDMASYFTYGWFPLQPKDFFLDGFKKLEQRSQKRVEVRREYIE
jgi:hypothetical protein